MARMRYNVLFLVACGCAMLFQTSVLGDSLVSKLGETTNSNPKVRVEQHQTSGRDLPHFELQPILRPLDTSDDLREDVGSRLASLAKQRYGTNELGRYAINQLDTIWRKSPSCQKVSRRTVSRIETLWKTEGSRKEASKDGFALTNEMAVLIWQTYHCLLADHHSLTPKAAARKSAQLDKLSRILSQIETEVDRQNSSLPEGTLASIKKEAEISIKRLKGYAESPAFPLVYYPLSDDAFSNAVSKVEEQLQASIKKFLEDYSQQVKKIRQIPGASWRAGPRAELRRWGKMNGRTLVSLTMGNVLRHYCLVERNLDYNDPAMFPFWKVNGSGVSYRMNEGISLQLSLERKEGD